MLKKYSEVYDFLKLPKLAKKLLNGDIQPPSLIYKSPFECYGFPPALLPFWSDGSSPSYIGFWKHWFNHREISIVNYSVEAQRCSEIARTLKQFPWVELLRIYDVKDLAKNIKKFAREFEIENLSRLDKIYAETGDLPEGLLNLAFFKKDSPLQCFTNPADYREDFPNDCMKLSTKNLINVCSFEISEELKEKISVMKTAPPWLVSQTQKKIFYDLLKIKDLNGAWMSLNSSGWTYIEAKTALQELAKKANNPGFSQLTSAWIEQPHELAGGY